MPTRLRRLRAERQVLFDEYLAHVTRILEMPAPVLTNAQTITLPQMRNERGQFAGRPNPPSLKQIYAFGQELCDGINGWREGANRQPVRISELPTVEQYQRLLTQIQAYHRVLDDRMPKTARIIGSRLNTSLANFFDQANRSYRAIQNLSTSIAAITPINRNRELNYHDRPTVLTVDVISDLLALCKAFQCIWNKESKSIDVLTPPVSILSPSIRGLRYEFGQFIIKLTSQGNLPLVKAHTPRVSTNGRLVHPHINSFNTLCFGEASIAATRAMKAGRIFDVVDLVVSVLNNYGSNPYERIEYWNGVCDVRIDPRTNQAIPVDTILPPEPTQIHTCTGCGSEVDTIVRCEGPDCELQEVCIGCLSRCGHLGCNRYMCEDHTIRCRNCDRRMCNNHNHISPSACDHCEGWQAPPTILSSSPELSAVSPITGNLMPAPAQLSMNELEWNEAESNYDEDEDDDSDHGDDEEEDF